ncbi:MAG: 4-hydroxythreonine-4-phosphate dehydrogenase PdxA [Oscillospiraceae bacterium]|jgi:4-hydroxythreonine-4-phosphate dehydrogenase|nr:4-hydroxythreonine-4-phosphate dehydrogenase PdxA [Oscillospiraceae bacterium]
MSQLPIIGITMGDPAGIGPEIAVKALQKKEIYTMCRPVLVGDAETFQRAANLVDSSLKVHPIYQISDAQFQHGTLDVYNLHNVEIGQLTYGKVSAMAGKAAYECVVKVIELALEHKIDATVTNPLNKEAMNLAGYHYSGHTEIYAKLTKTKDYAMMLACGKLRVIHVSTHVPLRVACDRVTKSRVYRVIHLANNACVKLGIKQPRIAVAGLNPHAGENGLFGREEIDEIAPAIKNAVADGLLVDGPVPPDTVFSKANGGMYDIVVAMYHDQGHIPLKVVGFQYNEKEQKWNAVEGVNITLGLPIIRSSVDHGTAFDQAWKGTACENSLIHSIEYATRLSQAI